MESTVAANCKSATVNFAAVALFSSLAAQKSSSPAPPRLGKFCQSQSHSCHSWHSRAALPPLAFCLAFCHCLFPITTPPASTRTTPCITDYRLTHRPTMDVGGWVVDSIACYVVCSQVRHDQVGSHNTCYVVCSSKRRAHAEAFIIPRSS